jgi:hypothetical protein
MFKWGKDERGRSTLHYDHRDTGTGYLGFSHARCNTAASADKTNHRPARSRWTPLPPEDTGPGPGW